MAGVIHEAVKTFEDGAGGGFVEDEVRLLRHGGEAERALLEINLARFNEERCDGPKEKQHGGARSVDVAGANEDNRVGPRRGNGIEQKSNECKKGGGENERDEEAQRFVDAGETAGAKKAETIFDFFLGPTERLGWIGFGFQDSSLGGLEALTRLQGIRRRLPSSLVKRISPMAHSHGQMIPQSRKMKSAATPKRTAPRIQWWA